MLTARLTLFVSVAAFGLLLLVLEMVRRRALAEKYSLLWLLMAGAILMLAVARPALDRIAPMLGIDPPVLNEAKRDMGPESAAVTVLCLLEKAATIRSPGAYLRRLTQMARNGAFSLGPMVSALANRRNCQLTI